MISYHQESIFLANILARSPRVSSGGISPLSTQTIYIEELPFIIYRSVLREALSSWIRMRSRSASSRRNIPMITQSENRNS